MEIGYVLLVAIFAIIQILMIVKFFQIAADIRLLCEVSNRGYESNVLNSKRYLDLVEATRNLEVPELKSKGEYGGVVGYYFNDVKLELFRDMGMWCCHDNNGKLVHAANKDEATRFFYYFLTSK